MITLLSGTYTFADLDWQSILGGFGLFLFGIKFMGDGLKSYAGDKLRDFIDRYTTKVWMGVLVGIVATILVQSSSASTAITIGFVRAGLMRLDQAVGIILGANIGTTTTAFLVGLKVERYALYFIFIGAMMLLFSKRKKNAYLGEIVLGFGVLFFGLSIMGTALKLLKDIDAFHDLALLMSDSPLLAVTGGAVMTGLIQSSSAMIAIIQKIYESGGIAFDAVLPFLFGSNIGTTVTAILAAMGGSLAARRAAGVHTLFNILVSVIAMILLVPYYNLIMFITDRFRIEPMMQIAISHIIFNIGGTLLFYPFIKQLVWIIRKVIRGEEQERIEINTNDFDLQLAKSLPSAALEISKRATIKMGEITSECLLETRKLFNKEQKASVDTVSQLEDIVNNFDSKITDYLLIISKEGLSEKDTDANSINLQIVKNLERIGDLSMNLAEFYDLVYDAKEDFSTSALEDVNNMYEVTMHMLNRAIRIYAEDDFALTHSISEDESYVDLLEQKARQRHFERMRSSECTTAVGSSVFIDILGTLERIADHADNIARSAFNVHTTHEPKIIDAETIESET
ncbi:MAG TPA: Na/Pi-cotransporter II [Erysipelotrichaceae bacterium]|nr:Na/Pi-cotransporter II [Erysipelotrichaceae bacterium]